MANGARGVPGLEGEGGAAVCGVPDEKTGAEGVREDGVWKLVGFVILPQKSGQ